MVIIRGEHDFKKMMESFLYLKADGRLTVFFKHRWVVDRMID